MGVTILGIAAIILHLLICCIFLYFFASHTFKVKAYVFPFVLLVPFWGCLCALLLDYHLRRHEEAVAEIPMEKLKIEDEIYKSLGSDNTQEKSIAPLNEALMLAPSEKRRNMMLDILNDAPEEYSRILLEARVGDDTEVVHYATTAMAEMSKRYDIEVQRFESAYAQDPKDKELVHSYADYLEEYLKSGMSEGRTAQIQREQLIKLLKELLVLDPSMSVYERITHQLIYSESYSEALEYAEKMCSLWPDKEEPRLLMIECYALIGDGNKLHACIRKAREDNVYFGQQGEEMIRFWGENA